MVTFIIVSLWLFQGRENIPASGIEILVVTSQFM